MIIYPNLEITLEMIKKAGFFVKDLGLLDAAISRAKTSLYGQDAYPSLSLKSAAIVHSIIRNHPMIDGNKRTSWMLLNFFLVLNGKTLKSPVDNGYEFIMAIAESRMELEEIAAWLDDHMIPLIPD